jgi:hypothetical protein
MSNSSPPERRFIDVLPLVTALDKAELFGRANKEKDDLLYSSVICGCSAISAMILG